MKIMIERFVQYHHDKNSKFDYLLLSSAFLLLFTFFFSSFCPKFFLLLYYFSQSFILFFYLFQLNSINFSFCSLKMYDIKNKFQMYTKNIVNISLSVYIWQQTYLCYSVAYIWLQFMNMTMKSWYVFFSIFNIHTLERITISDNICRKYRQS